MGSLLLFAGLLEVFFVMLILIVVFHKKCIEFDTSYN